MAFQRMLFQLLTVVFLGMTLATTSVAQTFTDFFDFNGTNGGGTHYAVLAQGRDGQLYGTTAGGGANNLGVVFRINTAGVESVLYNFDGTHGWAPTGGLTLASDGNFYGTTQVGGSNGLGVLFRITPSGTLTVLYNFGNGGKDPKTHNPPPQTNHGNFFVKTPSDQTRGGFK